MKKYKSINVSDPRKELPDIWFVLRTDDNIAIPMDFDNQAFIDYLAWLDEGNEPDILDIGELWLRN